MAVAVLIVSYQSRATLDACLHSVREADEVVVVDNASTDGTVAHLEKNFAWVRVLASPRNVGFGRAVNLGAAATRSPRLLVLNPDAALAPGDVARLEARLDEARAALGAWAVGFAQQDAAGHAQLAFGLRPSLAAEALRRTVQRRLDRPGSTGARLAAAALRRFAPGPRPVAWVAGSALLVERAAFVRVGGFDPGYFLYFEDIDFCLRLERAGGRVVFDPTLTVLHHRGRSMAQVPKRARAAYRDSQRRLARAHMGPLEGRLVAAWAGWRRP